MDKPEPLKLPGLVCRLPSCNTQINPVSGKKRAPRSTGRTRQYCSDAHRKAAYRERAEVEATIRYLLAVRDSYLYDTNLNHGPLSLWLNPDHAKTYWRALNDCRNALTRTEQYARHLPKEPATLRDLRQGTEELLTVLEKAECDLGGL
jgi:hypothetical protein